jgi:hypothetical protein
MKSLFTSTLFLVFTGLFSKVFASEPDTLKPKVTAIRIDHPISLTGKLDDQLWLKAMHIELNYEVLPGENTPSKLKTEVSVLYDNENLYIGFRCYDSLPGNIRANQLVRCLIR